ncbi:hypothetical protein GBA52_016273 [Prunus armeniaca]|nr:hypothetical protein GBA52_016273 [Prunus armeniaca]
MNLRFQESKEERFANYGINLELWSLYRSFSLLRSGFLVYGRSDHINLPTQTQHSHPQSWTLKFHSRSHYYLVLLLQNYDSLHSSYNSHHQEPNFDRTLQAN